MSSGGGSGTGSRGWGAAGGIPVSSVMRISLDSAAATALCTG
jgi:hypothetical protein